MKRFSNKQRIQYLFVAMILVLIAFLSEPLNYSKPIHTYSASESLDEVNDSSKLTTVTYILQANPSYWMAEVKDYQELTITSVPNFRKSISLKVLLLFTVVFAFLFCRESQCKRYLTSILQYGLLKNRFIHILFMHLKDGKKKTTLCLNPNY